MTRSTRQLQEQACNLIRQAYGQGWNTDALAIDFAVAAMGEEYRAMIEKVHARHFTITTAN